MINPEEKVNQIIPLDHEKQVSELLSIELDVWKYLTSYLSFSDKAALRLVCHFFFREVLSSPPAWKQWVSVNDIQAFKQKNKEFGWGNRPIYGIFFPNQELIDPKWQVSLPFPLSAFDVSNHQPLLNVSNELSVLSIYQDLPKSLKILKLHYFSDITEGVVKYFLATYPNLFLQFEGTNLLRWACYYGWKDIAFEITKQIKNQAGPFAKLNINDGDNIYTPLALAVQKGHIEIVKLLLDQGENVNQEGKSGLTPLTVAIQKRHFEIVKLLLDAGADINKNSQTNQIDLEKLLQESLSDNVVSLKSYRSNHTQIFPSVLASNKKNIYIICGKVTPSNEQAREMGHQILLWLDYLCLNNFTFSLEFTYRHLELFCLALIDHYLEGSTDLRERCPTDKIVKYQTLNDLYQKQEVYGLFNEINALKLQNTLTIKTPLSMLQKMFSLLPQSRTVKNTALVLLDAYNLNANVCLKQINKMAAAVIAVARYWVLEKQVEAWPQEYVDKTNMSFESFKEEYNEVHSIAYLINVYKKKYPQEANAPLATRHTRFFTQNQQHEINTLSSILDEQLTENRDASFS